MTLEVPEPNASTSWLRAQVGRLRREGFVQSVGILAGGTAVAQAATVIVLPVLTRMYSPRDFSLLAVYASMLGLVSVAACLRFEIAIPIPERDEDAMNLLALAVGSAVVTTAIVLIAVAIVPVQIAALVKQPAVRPYLLLLPAGIFLSGSFSALQFWSMRSRHFGLTARARVGQSIAGAGAQVALGSNGGGPFGLLLGQTIGSGAGFVGLLPSALKDNKSALRSVSISSMIGVFHDYSRFPKYSVLEGLGNTAGIQLPIIIIAALSAGPEAGFLLLAIRTMQAPTGLIGGAVSQVYLSHASDEFRAGNLGPFTAAVMAGLAKSGTGPLIFAGIVAPAAFPLIFGSEWARAGELVSWMTPWFVMQFLASPVSMTLHVTRSQRAALALQAFGVVLRVGSVLATAAFAPHAIVEAFALSGFVFYLVYIGVVAILANISRSDLLKALKPSLPFICAWAGAAVLLRLIPGMLSVFH